MKVLFLIFYVAIQAAPTTTLFNQTETLNKINKSVMLNINNFLCLNNYSLLDDPKINSYRPIKTFKIKNLTTNQIEYISYKLSAMAINRLFKFNLMTKGLKLTPLAFRELSATFPVNQIVFNYERRSPLDSKNIFGEEYNQGDESFSLVFSKYTADKLVKVFKAIIPNKDFTSLAYNWAEELHMGARIRRVNLGLDDELHLIRHEYGKSKGKYFQEHDQNDIYNLKWTHSFIHQKFPILNNFRWSLHKSTKNPNKGFDSEDKNQKLLTNIDEISNKLFEKSLDEFPESLDMGKDNEIEVSVEGHRILATVMIPEELF